MHYSRNSVRYSCNIADARAITDKSHCRSFPVLPAWQAALITAFLVLLVSGPVFPAAPEKDAALNVLSLENAVAVAIEGNPGLAEMQARAEAMATIPSQAGTLPDPMVSLGALNFPTDTFDRDQEPMTQLQIGIEQSLPFPGKLGLKERAAEFDADGFVEIGLESLCQHQLRQSRLLYLIRKATSMRDDLSNK